jgi:UTRA domain
VQEVAALFGQPERRHGAADRAVQARDGFPGRAALDVAAADQRHHGVLIDREPTHTLTSYYRPEHVENTPIVDPKPGTATPGGGFAVLTLQGLEPDHMTETVHARMPSPQESAELELPAGEPVVILHRTTYTADDVAVEFRRGHPCGVAIRLDLLVHDPGLMPR